MGRGIGGLVVGSVVVSILYSAKLKLVVVGSDQADAQAPTTTAT